MDWCWSWNSNALATWWGELMHWKRPWYWARLKPGGEGDDRGWDGWMASLTQWTWVSTSPGSCWWTGKPGMLQSMGSQRGGHNWTNELNWIDIWEIFFSLHWSNKIIVISLGVLECSQYLNLYFFFFCKC